MRLAVIMSVQDELICVCLVMPRCMFNMQLFLSEIVKEEAKHHYEQVFCVKCTMMSKTCLN